MLELLVLAIAPAAFLLLYIWKKDSYEPEPLRLVAWIFLLGALSTIPVYILELLFGGDIVFSAVFVAPVVEELLKFLVVFLAVYRHPEFDEPMDGIVYAAAAGLGFATIENIKYVFEFEMLFSSGIGEGIIRAFTALPGHVIFSCIWGFALGTAKFRPASQRTGIIIAGLLGAMLLHGIYNAVNSLAVLLVIVLLGWWMTCRNIRSAHADLASACSAMNRLPDGSGIPDAPSPASTPPQAAQNAPALAPGPVTTAAVAGDIPGTRKGTHRFCTACGAPDEFGKQFCGNCGKKF